MGARSIWIVSVLRLASFSVMGHRSDISGVVVARWAHEAVAGAVNLYCDVFGAVNPSRVNCSAIREASIRHVVAGRDFLGVAPAA